VTELVKLVMIIVGVGLLAAGCLLPPKPWGWISALAGLGVFVWLQFLWGWTVGSVAGALVATAIFIARNKRLFAKEKT
jgi:hypothetical protein